MKKSNFLTPPVTENSKGKERTAGVEFEFTGLEMEFTAELIVDLFGGKIEELSSYEFKISETSFGDFKLELDASLFLNKKYEDLFSSLGINLDEVKNKKKIEGVLRNLASSVVPFEIITPPIQISELFKLEQLIQRLKKEKAKGTKDKFFYAFGLHLNPEAPSMEARDILKMIQAFVLLEPWIREKAEIDFSRRLTPYINQYDDLYKQQVLSVNYSPDISQLITDYMEFGNDRNQSLDLLPLFEYMDKKRVKEKLNDGLTSPRPTYHYRLPNCDLNNENWSLSNEWNRWVQVERMANSDKLKQYSAKYRNMMLDSISRPQKKWIELINRWVDSG